VAVLGTPVLDAPELDAHVLDAQVLAVAWPSGGGAEEPFCMTSVVNTDCVTPMPCRHCCPCARMAIFLWP
jgi:hypothetical protein